MFFWFRKTSKEELAAINNINRDIASIREISPDGNGLVLVLSIFPSIFLSK